MILALAAALGAGPPQDPAFNPLGDQFTRQIRPLIQRSCLKCHSTRKKEGDLDLERFASLAEVRKAPKTWQEVGRMIDSGQMPPEEAKPLSDEDRGRLSGWVRGYLEAEAVARAGDPGPVVLRRLSNAEYTYTLRDLTGVASLDPAREFPADSASGEGFMNVGQSLVMSPALVTKYLDAAKEVAAHAMLLPDGIRFSPAVTRRDWTEELLGEIRATYHRYTDTGGGTAVDLQGIRFDTKDGGVLPLEKYLAALKGGPADGLSAKYLKTLRETLDGGAPSLLLDPIRARWRAGDVAGTAREIARWQRALWKFNSVGHIGKAGGPKAWMEAVSPLQTRQEVRLKIPASPDGKPVTLYLLATDAGDGSEGDEVVWERPRLTAPGRPDLLLRDARGVCAELLARRERLFSGAARFLAAAAEADPAGVDPADLAAWREALGIGGPARIEGHFTTKIDRSSDYDFIKGWGSHETPNLVANSSGRHVRIPGNMKPHGVAVHPSPKLAVTVAWRSPAAAKARVEAKIQHAHPECGNGVTWTLDVRRGAVRTRLSNGVAQGGNEVKPKPVEDLDVKAGDLVALSIGPRDGNHACDLTAVGLSIAAGDRRWDLAGDVSPDVLAGNPHADRFGNEGVWHFVVEPDAGVPGPVIPAGSLLAKWQTSDDPEEKRKLAAEVQELLTSGPPAKKDSPDAALYRMLASFNGPLLRGRPPVAAPASPGPWGADPSLFTGEHLRMHAPSLIEVVLPADLVEGCEFVAAGALHPEAGREGSVQLQILTAKPDPASGLLPGAVTETRGNGPWTSNDRSVSNTAPILVAAESAARRRIDAALDDFRRVFPAALCYTKIVPVDEVVTLTLFYREDLHFARLLLDEAEAARLDRLWDELHTVSQDALTLVDAFEQLWQYATQDADPKVFEPMREPIARRAAEFRKRLAEIEPKHVEAALKFAADAWRRPLKAAEQDELRGLYRGLRGQEMSHDEAVRLMLARILVSPAFLYRAEKPGDRTGPVDDRELAVRLSYFLWSSAPDAPLRDPAAEARRMLADPRVRRLAVEFGAAWLQIHGFDELDEKSERHFPTFAGLRGAMYEESILFLTDFFQRDGSILDLLDADHTFLNEALAKHYGIPGVTGPDWRRVEGVKKHGRGGILGLATTLAKNSGASRTSPILRGTWISEVLLGERLPKPPREVPLLPEEEPSEELTMRQLVEKHTADPKCAVCHKRIDPYGFSLEGFDAVGRRREKAADTRVVTIDGAEFDGIEGLRNYLLTKRRDAFVTQFCRKLLGYALGREVLFSDEPLLKEMRAKLEANGYHVSVAVESVVRSRQFREIRGKENAHDE